MAFGENRDMILAARERSKSFSVEQYLTTEWIEEIVREQASHGDRLLFDQVFASCCEGSFLFSVVLFAVLDDWGFFVLAI